jgi:hypothetical protein
MATLKIKIGSASAWDIETQYSGKISLLEMPKNIALKPKNIYSHSWLDENGDDEYLPSTIYYEPVTIPMKFSAKVDNPSSTGTLRATVKQFLDAIIGKTFSFYAPVQGIGRGDCRVDSLDADAAYHNLPIAGGTSYEERLVFTVNVKINDPYTPVTL